MPRQVLLVIDMLNDFLDKWEPASRQQLVRATNELVGFMREFGHPIIWVRQEFEPDLRAAFPEMKAKGIRMGSKGRTAARLTQVWR